MQAREGAEIPEPEETSRRAQSEAESNGKSSGVVK